MRKYFRVRRALQVSAESIEKFEKFWREHEGSPLRGRAHILAGLCPQIHGMSFVKLATLVMLVGGSQRVDQSGTRIRGQIHVLIVGDPGTGTPQKSLINP
jgi:DNA helicase MCM9